MIDEIEEYVRKSEHILKELLDGNSSIDNLLILSSTNYISEIPDTICDRPSRFKLVLEFKPIEDINVMMSVAKRILKGNPTITDEMLLQAFAEKKTTTLDEIKHIIQDLIMGTRFMFEKRNIGFRTRRSASMK